MNLSLGKKEKIGSILRKHVCVCGEVRYECVMEELVFTFQQSLIIIGLRRTEDLVSTVVLNCDIKQSLNIV